jgi:hypothetical protein
VALQEIQCERHGRSYRQNLTSAQNGARRFNCSRSKRGAIEDVLELGHGVSREILGMLVLDGLATVVTETLMSNGATFKIERMQITDAGRLAIQS